MKNLHTDFHIYKALRKECFFYQIILKDNPITQFCCLYNSEQRTGNLYFFVHTIKSALSCKISRLVICLKKGGVCMFKRKIAVVTGGANGIGKCIAEQFEKNGATVCVIDKTEGSHFIGDIADKATLERFADYVKEKYGGIDFLVNNALPITKGINECTYEEFEYALKVGVTAPFYLSKLFLSHFRKGGSIINISSSRDRMSQPQTESYTAAKGGIASLTHALAVSLSGKIRVNSISPGWIDTSYKEWDGPDAFQQPAGRVGNPMDIAEMVMFLCSDKAGFITGENICIDGGMTKLMIYHGDHGWTLEND